MDLVFEFLSAITADSLHICVPGESKAHRALSTSTYGEVSPIFLGKYIANSDIFRSK